MFSSASEVFINALCRVVTTYKIVVFKFQFTVSQNWTPVDAAPWGALDAYRFIREDNTPIGNFLLCYADRFVEIRFDPWYDGAEPTEKQMALVGTVLGGGPLS